jgi:sortase A
MAKKILLPLFALVFIALIPRNIAPASDSDSEIGKPVRLMIPSINVNATIQHLGLASNGSIGAPDGPYDVAWFNAGPKPGEQGSAIISGHYGHWRTGADSVFDNLDKLKKGDKIYVRDDKDNLISFTVESSRTYNLDESPPEILNKTDDAYLNLITCNGDWIQDKKTYTKRLVIFTRADH